MSASESPRAAAEGGRPTRIHPDPKGEPSRWLWRIRRVVGYRSLSAGHCLWLALACLAPLWLFFILRSPPETLELVVSLLLLPGSIGCGVCSALALCAPGRRWYHIAAASILIPLSGLVFLAGMMSFSMPNLSDNMDEGDDEAPSAAVVSPAPAPHPRTVSKAKVALPFDKTASGTTLRASAPDYFGFQILRPSPDGRYTARLLIGDAEVGYLSIFARHEGSQEFRQKVALSRMFRDTQSAIWVPGHGHWLLVATGDCDYGEGMIALWTSPHHTRFLRRARHPEGEGYDIVSVTPDGRALRYAHLETRRTLHSVKLPAR